MTTAAGIVRDLAADERWFATEAGRIAALCAELAERFAAGGRLLACGAGPAERSDARHVAVEFVHPVIVGKRALPALCVEAEDLALLAEPGDALMGFGPVDLGGVPGCTTIGFGAEAAWAFTPPGGDPLVAQEVAETTYHVLWELVHVFFERRGTRGGTGSGASSFLYPFLEDRAQAPGDVLADVEASVRAKAAEATALRRAVLAEPALGAAADTLRAVLAGGGRVLALGNGGSATDAMDLVADLRHPPPARGWAARPALDLTEDPSVLTAVANDVGVEQVFARQVIAHGRPGDALVALSTSGGSGNVLAALAEARRRGLVTIALVGYDGGPIAADALADHVVVVRSEHLPRIQEAQGTALHALRAAVA